MTVRRISEQQLTAAFPRPLWSLLNLIRQEAGEVEFPLYFVGGLVRDLLLGIPSMDIDLVVEGDAIIFVNRLQQKFGGEVRRHDRFGTAKWRLNAKVWHLVDGPTDFKVKKDVEQMVDDETSTLPTVIDFASARTEYYARPSVLPNVQRSKIEDDLERRDFTFNTLAIRLDGRHFGEILDHHQGLQDLAQRHVRVLHPASFEDDPTRIFRAVRLEQRLQFTIEPLTLAWLRQSLPLVDRVTGDRIRHEIERSFVESRPHLVLSRLSELDALQYLTPNLSWPAAAEADFKRLSTLLTQDARWQQVAQKTAIEFLYFALWMLHLPKPVPEILMKRLRVRKTTREDLRACFEAREIMAATNKQSRPSVVERQLRGYTERVLLVVRASLGDEVRASLLDLYFQEWRLAKTTISGADIAAFGLKPGPIYGQLLDKVLAARLDGEINSAAEEKALLAELVRNIDV